MSYWKSSSSMALCKTICLESCLTPKDFILITGSYSYVSLGYVLLGKNQDKNEKKLLPRCLVYKGDLYTQLIRWNFNDPLTTSNSTYGFGTNITGYGDRANFTQPFAAENIIMLYDGYCASTCTIFSELMRIQGGVKSIAMGGRPNTNPIQGVGGIKGAQILAFSDIQSYAQQTINQTTAAGRISTSVDLPPYPWAAVQARALMSGIISFPTMCRMVFPRSMQSRRRTAGSSIRQAW